MSTKRKAKSARDSWPKIKPAYWVDGQTDGKRVMRFFIIPADKKQAKDTEAVALSFAKDAATEARKGWLVDARLNGKGTRKFFDTEREADTFADLSRTRRSNEGSSAVSDDRLARYGWTVQKAIEFAVKHLEKLHGSIGIAEAVAALLEFKRPNVSADRLSDISNRLNRVSKQFAGRTIASVTSTELNDFLLTIPHPATRNDYRKEAVMLWSYARSKSWVSERLDKHLVPRSAEPDKAPIILTVAQASRLMEASTDADIRALNAMVLFGGLRREEVEKLDWAAVDFRTGHINVTAKISKVRSERFCPMSDNLRAWLMPLAKSHGPIIKRNLMHPLRRVWKAANLYPWPQDAHRHSFISYRRQIVGDSKTALEGGTSEKIIKSNYKRPVLPEDAEAYFAISPEPSKIVRLPAAG